MRMNCDVLFSRKLYSIILLVCLTLGSTICSADEVDDYHLNRTIIDALHYEMDFDVERLIVVVKDNNVRLSGRLRNPEEIRHVIDEIYKFDRVQKVKIDMFRLDYGNDVLSEVKDYLNRKDNF